MNSHDLPVILIGGPPHSGKSVLAHALSQALRATTPHYVMRAAPDGEGDFSYEARQEVVRNNRAKGNFTSQWVERICRDIALRQTQLIVEIGGMPTPAQRILFDQAPYKVILLTKDPSSHTWWHMLVREHNLELMADLTSIQDGISQLYASEPWISGSVAGLRRGEAVHQNVLKVLSERVAREFRFSFAEIEAIHFAKAPFGPDFPVLNMDGLMRQLHGTEAIPRFTKSDIDLVSDIAAAHKSLAVYGRTPAIMLAAIARATVIEWLFDIRLGWIRPPQLRVARVGEPSAGGAQLRLDFNATGIEPQRLDVLFGSESYLLHDACNDVVLPHVDATVALEVSGKLPLWLVAAIMRAYTDAGVKMVSFTDLRLA